MAGRRIVNSFSSCSLKNQYLTISSTQQKDKPSFKGGTGFLPWGRWWRCKNILEGAHISHKKGPCQSWPTTAWAVSVVIGFLSMGWKAGWPLARDFKEKVVDRVVLSLTPTPYPHPTVAATWYECSRGEFLLVSQPGQSKSFITTVAWASRPIAFSNEHVTQSRSLGHTVRHFWKIKMPAHHSESTWGKDTLWPSGGCGVHMWSQELLQPFCHHEGDQL